MKLKRQQESRVQKGVLADNKRARFDIAVQEDLIAGLVLSGDEIKSIRGGRVELSGSYIKLMYGGQSGALTRSKRRSLMRSKGFAQKTINPEVYLVGANLALAAEPSRSRKLLLHQREIRDLEELINEKGMTAVPLSLFLSHGYAKLKVGIGRGRKNQDKRELIKARDLEREQNAELKQRGKWIKI